MSIKAEYRGGRGPGYLMEILCSPWSMMPKRLQTLKSRLAEKPAAEIPTHEPRTSVSYGRQARIAHVPLIGVMTRYPSEYDDYCGFCAVEPIAAAIQIADADAGVDAIEIDMDTPGGLSDAGAVLAAAVRQTRKPVTVVVDGLGASAGYRVIAAADKSYATKDSLIGSIGTYCLLADDTKFWEEKLGVKWHLVSTGRFKGLGADGKVTQDLLDDIQREINDMQASFQAEVRQGRGIDQGKMKELADGRVWLAPEAQQLGLIDEVASRDAAMMANEQEIFLMTKEEFSAFAAAHPEATKPFIEQGYNQAKAELTPKAATVAELEAEFPGNSDFVLAQVKAGATIEQAKAAHAQTAVAELATAKVELKTAKEDLVKAKAETAKLQAYIANPGQGPIPVEISAGGQADPKAVSADRKKELMGMTTLGRSAMKE